MFRVSRTSSRLVCALAVASLVILGAPSTALAADPPQAVDDYASVDSYWEPTLVYPTDNDTPLSETIKIVSCPDSAHATVDCSDGYSVEYIPRHGDYFVGDDPVQYAIRDANGQEDTATIHFDRHPVQLQLDLIVHVQDGYTVADTRTKVRVQYYAQYGMAQDEPLNVQMRPQGATTWQPVKTVTLPAVPGDNATHWFEFFVTAPIENSQLRVVHRASEWLEAANDTDNFLVRPDITANLSSTQGAGGEPVRLSGTIGPVDAGQTLSVQRFSMDNGVWVTIEKKTLATGTEAILGKAYSFSVTPRATGKTTYRVQCSAGDRRGSAQSRYLNYQAT